ncbi:MAG: undecaprenyl-diphosphate phosphatase [Candidatus Aminicenantes bacterium]|nr:MAG: undecaprenyl-diphosphate phosphatase [Candidatus Aminicenantes bacterium]
MSLIAIIILGIIQGLTEFFPVSSSGHLVLFQNLFGLKEPQILADVMLHVGTLISLFVFLRRELLQLFKGALEFLKNPQRHHADPRVKQIFALVVASIPTFFIGYFFSDFFESLFASLRTVGLALVFTACFLFLTRWAKTGQKNFLLHPFIIGILQGAAIVPGFSRSGLTIGGAMFLGWKREDAARFSFLLSIPAILGAAVFQLGKIDISSQSWPIIITGIVVSAIVGYIALAVLVSVINRGKFYVFSYYCFLAGLAAIVFSFVL